MIGAAIKKAGWDAIVIEGASDEPVYLKIDDDDVEIKPADQVWGQGTRATTEALSRKRAPISVWPPSALPARTCCPTPASSFPQPFRRRWSRRRHGLEEIEGARRAR